MASVCGQHRFVNLLICNEVDNEDKEDNKMNVCCNCKHVCKRGQVDRRCGPIYHKYFCCYVDQGQDIIQVAADASCDLHAPIIPKYIKLWKAKL